MVNFTCTGIAINWGKKKKKQICFDCTFNINSQKSNAGILQFCTSKSTVLWVKYCKIAMVGMIFYNPNFISKVLVKRDILKLFSHFRACLQRFGLY